MAEQNFDSKTIRYLYVSMIIAGLAFTGEFGFLITIPSWIRIALNHCSVNDCYIVFFFRNKYLFVWSSIFPISSCHWHLCFTISSHIKKLSNINNLLEFNACWFQSQAIPWWRRKTFRFTQACFIKLIKQIANMVWVIPYGPYHMADTISSTLRKFEKIKTAISMALSEISTI